MTHLTRLLASTGAVLLLGAAPSFAQSITATGGGSIGSPGSASTSTHSLSSMQTVRNPNQQPAFHVFGIPVVIAAPLDAPYNSADAYSTYAGQPGYGPNAVLAASLGGTP